MAIQRVCAINAVVANPDVPLFKVYGSAGLQNGAPLGTLSVGPPAWNDATEYFTGNVTAVEKTDRGVKLAAFGTFGTRVASGREAASVFVEIADGLFTVSGLTDEYSVAGAKAETGSITIYPVANPTN